MNRVHYKVKITPTEEIYNIPILEGVEPKFIENSETFTKEGDLYINKLIDNCFYINEGVRYFLIYQIVDNATYGTGECVSLKSLLMPITLMRNKVPVCSDSGKNYMVNSLDVLLFAKKVSPLLYTFSKESYNSLIKLDVENKDMIIDAWQKYRDPSLIKKFNSFFKVDFKFSDDVNDLLGEDRIIFHVSSEKESGVYFSVPKSEMETENNNLTKTLVGCLLNIKNETKKKKIIFTYDNLISPWFWIDKISAFFTKNSDATKKFEKTKTMLISLSRLVDKPTRKLLNIPKADKENTLTIIRYIMREFEKLVNADSQDLDNKRVRLFEYQVFPLREYFSNQVYRVLNSTTHSKAILDRIFSNLNPMYIIRQTISNELLRYYNATNELNLFSCLLKYTFKGPQSLNKTVAIGQRDIHESYPGRLSLVASSASEPGISGNLSVFVETYNGFFKKQKNL